MESTTNSAFASQDNVFNNTSGMSAAMFIGALTNPASLLANYYNNHNGNKQQQYRFTNSGADADSESCRHSTFSSTFATIVDNQDDAVQPPLNTTLSGNSFVNSNKHKQQRNPWSFGWLSSPPLSPPLDPSVQQQQQQRSTPELSLPATESNNVTTLIPQQQKG